MKSKCKISRSIKLCVVELQLFEVEELDVCGSLALGWFYVYFVLTLLHNNVIALEHGNINSE